MEKVLKQFENYLEVLNNYNHAITQMHWDMQTQTPSKGYANKVEVVTYLSSKVFEMETAPEYGELLEKLTNPKVFAQLNDGMQVTVKRRKKEYEEKKRIPKDFYEEMVRAKAQSQKAWEEAKHKDDYGIFCPHLQKMIDDTRQLVAYSKPDMDVYDALLDLYEEGMDRATLDSLFEELKEGVTSLLKKIEQQPTPKRGEPDGPYPIHKQKELGAFLLDYIGFDKEAGVMGESEHPFTMGFGPGDVRVTNHYREDDAINAMFSMIHEGGHAIFEQGVDERYEKTDVVVIPFLGLHESQSRFFENILGRNIHFWEPIYDQVTAFFPQWKEFGLEAFYQEINRVTPGFIRTDSDELSYSLHIILRYELEKAIFCEGVEAEQLPQLWNDKMEELLGIRPKHDAEGILQDIHWSDGSFGYFPTYALGNIFDGMLLEKITEELGDINKILAEGRVKEITAWLREKIHQYGSLRAGKEAVETVCERKLSVDPIMKYFDEKYLRLYDLV